MFASTNEGNNYFDGLISGLHEYKMEKIMGRLKGIPRNNTPSKDDKSKKITFKS